MDDLSTAKKQLFHFTKLLTNWEMNGYDTPQYTYHEQLDVYKEKIEILKNEIKEMK